MNQLCILPVVPCIEDHSLFENMHSTKKMSECRLRINSATVKQVQGNKSHLKWVILSTQIFACQRGYICNVFFFIYIFLEKEEYCYIQYSVSVVQGNRNPQPQLIPRVVGLVYVHALMVVSHENVAAFVLLQHVC